jgi:hypothetical protein
VRKGKVQRRNAVGRRGTAARGAGTGMESSSPVSGCTNNSSTTCPVAAPMSTSVYHLTSTAAAKDST